MARCHSFAPLSSSSSLTQSLHHPKIAIPIKEISSSSLLFSVASSTAGSSNPPNRRSMDDEAETTKDDTENSNNKIILHDDATINTTDATTSTTKSTMWSFLVTLWQFTRPHTLIGSALAIPALYLLAAPPSFSLLSTTTLRPFLGSILYAMIPSLLMNLYITGLNQITDVEIDKINKPQLPIPAGRLSIPQATGIVTVALIASLVMGAYGGGGECFFLNVALWGSGILGTLYSLPPFRWKRFPILAATCVVAVRGTIINAAFFAHARTFFQVPWNVPSMWYSSAFFCVFGMVIAIIKDVPDIVGDKISNIRTFSVRVGAKRMLQIGTILLESLLYGTGLALLWTAVLAATTTTQPIRHPWKWATGIAAIGAGLSVRRKASTVDPQSPSQVYQYYMHLWKLFYLAYAALPFVR